MRLEYSKGDTPFIQMTETDRLSFSQLTKIDGMYNRLFFSGIEPITRGGQREHVRVLADMQMTAELLKTRKCECYIDGTLKSILKKIKKYLTKDGELPEECFDKLAIDVSKVTPIVKKIKHVRTRKKRKTKKAVKK